MKKRLLGILVGVMALTVQAKVTVTNVSAVQVKGAKMVQISYDVSSTETNAVKVSLLVSNDAQTVSAPSVSGDVGSGVATGTGKMIVWDMGADWNGNVAELLFSVVADGSATYLVVDLLGGASAESYPVSSLDAVPDGGWTDEYKTMKLVLRRIPAGTFTMGSPFDELGRFNNETQYEVTLTEDFFIGVFEVTQKQWELVTGNKPSYFNNSIYYQMRPVEQVSYNDIRGLSEGVGWPSSDAVDASSFVGKLQVRTGLALDLPTESQWEYACRAGTITALNSGKNLSNTDSDANMNEVGRYYYNGGSDYSSNCAATAGTATVGSYLSNAWGLYDMHGNVLEWCLDWYGPYPESGIDPVGAESGSYRVFRGGVWIGDARDCRSADRSYYYPEYCIGLRLQCASPAVEFDSGSASLFADARDYTLEISSDHGSPTPVNGVHSNYCWGSSVTCTPSRETGWKCTGWSGTGSVPSIGTTNTTGAITLTNLFSSIIWNWQKTVTISNLAVMQVPGMKLIEISYDVWSTETNSVTVLLLISNGTQAVSAPSVSGDVGSGVVTGTGKLLTWDMGVDWGGNAAELFYTLVADDGVYLAAPDYLVIDLSGGASFTNYPVNDAVPDNGWTDEYRTTKLVLRRIPAGSFMMGSPSNELGRSSNEMQHEVTLTENFFIGVFEVTQKQWELVTGSNPSLYTTGDVYPVQCVSYNDIRGSSVGAGWPSSDAVDASSFVGKLQARTGLLLDLPTESQWEYACRAGTSRAYNDYTENDGAGSDCLCSPTCFGIDANLQPLAWYYDQTSGDRIRYVGRKQANAWGLYDMHGNVAELCLDWYGDYPGSVVDPAGAPSGTYRVHRGGSWYINAPYCRSACRGIGLPGIRGYDTTGLRLRCSLPVQYGTREPASSFVHTFSDARDYTLTVASDHGSPVPPIGVHSNYCRYSSVTCSVEEVASDGWMFTGWSGDATTGYTQTNAVVLMDAVSKSVRANFSNDADGDGLLNSNEFALGSNPRNGDSDGDHMGDREEWVAGTSLTNSASILKVTCESQPDGSRLISWSGVAGRYYTFEYTDSLNSPWSTYPFEVPGAGVPIGFVDNYTGGSRFYRVKVHKP